jgi:hypothetical protein
MLTMLPVMSSKKCSSNVILRNTIRFVTKAKLRKAACENGVSTTITRYNGAFHGFFNMITILDDAQSAHAQASTLLKKYLD